MEEIAESLPHNTIEGHAVPLVKSIENILGSSESRVLMNPYYLSELDSGVHDVEILGIQETTKLLQFRGESGHDVRSYIATLDVHSSENHETHDMPVVIKRHTTPQKAEQEYKNVLKVIKRGVVTPPPLAFVSDGKESYILFTFDQNLRAADTINWRSFPEAERENEIALLLDKYARALARLNALGIYHLDAQPRNVSYSRDSAEVSFFDFEAAHIVDNNKHKRVEVHVPHASKELQRVLWGCCREGIIDMSNGRDGAIEQFNQAFLTPYFAALGQLDSRFTAMQDKVAQSFTDAFQLPR